MKKCMDIYMSQKFKVSQERLDHVSFTNEFKWNNLDDEIVFGR